MRGLLGPVFALEMVVGARRWQVYAGRAAFVALLLACLWRTWQVAALYGSRGMIEREQLVRTGYVFYSESTIVAFILVLVAAPAATAGAICVDKARGTLAHLLATDLTDREIVLGKLAARLLPVLATLACALPVSALAVLLGGVDPVALAGNFLIAVGLAALGCSLAMLLSVWGSRPHEVLAVVFTTWSAWLLPRFLIDLIGQRPRTPLMDALGRIDPFWLAIDSYDPFQRSGPTSVAGAASFLAGSLLLSALLAATAVRSLRPAMDRLANRKARPIVESGAARRFHRDVPWWPNPSLDRNPVLWREWHRSRPTPWMRAVWGAYLGVAGLAGLALVGGNLATPTGNGPGYARAPIGPLGMAGMLAFGLLLMSVTSATSLAEERVRGSLDVLLTTPLPTRSIVWGKWRGTFRLAPLVLFWPALVCYAMAARVLSPAQVSGFYAMVPYGLAWAAFVTSLGLALATWTRRLGRALTIAVAINVALTVGAPMLGSEGPFDPIGPASPFEGMVRIGNLMEGSLSTWEEQAVLAGCLGWSAAYAALAAALLVAVLLSFNRALGRSPERPRRPPSRRAGIHPPSRWPRLFRAPTSPPTLPCPTRGEGSESSLPP